MALTQLANAQKFKGQYAFTFAAGYHGSQFVQKTYNNTFKPTDLKTPPIVLYGINFDLGLGERFSAGITSSYIQLKSTYSGYTNSTGQTVVQTSTETYKSSDLGIRLLIHLGQNDDFDPYLGGKLGFSSKGFYTNSEHGFIPETLRKEMGKGITPQMVTGFKYYFSEHMGINLELGLGQAYNGLIGICYRGGGN